ncbi:DUF2238 domain-containing protein [Pigmentiphaga soli]|uniref:DUF2238 domain-containing protein n=1 Tax=Pigmentiphaga soli TaxID=1007095 RepID=A0ABP8H5H4_9BURK
MKRGFARPAAGAAGYGAAAGAPGLSPYVAGLALAFALFWAALAVAPLNRRDWALENALVVAFVAALAAGRRHFALSPVSYTLIFVFLCLHTVGAHYTYAKVPYDDWWRALAGRTLNETMGWRRNHFDRLVHLSYGLLLAYPIREFFLRVVDARGFWSYFLPLDFALASSATYELIEWGAAYAVGGDLGMAYLGTQGDVWDAHKDMALAAAGALLAMIATAAINAWRRRDAAREWVDRQRRRGDGRGPASLGQSA